MQGEKPMDKAQLFWSAYRKRLRIGFSTCGACERIVRLKAEHLAMKFRHSDVWTRIRTEAAILACHDYAHLLKRRVCVGEQLSLVLRADQYYYDVYARDIKTGELLVA